MLVALFPAWVLFNSVKPLIFTARHACCNCGEIREAAMAQRRLSAYGRAELEAKREQLQPELRLIEGELDEAVRVQAAVRPADARPRLSGRWRHWVE